MNWINKFINYLKINNIKLDFFSIHSFSNKYSSIEILTPFNLNKEKRNANKSESLSVSINRIKKVLKETKFEPTELFISEWNSSPYFLDLIHDT